MAEVGEEKEAAFTRDFKSNQSLSGPYPIIQTVAYG